MNNRLAIWEKIKKQYGDDGFNFSENKVEVITTGSHALDDAIGVFGLPRGRLVQYAGMESCGKTLMSLIAIREWQKLNKENWAVFIDSEYTYDPQWSSSIGVDNDRVLVYKENCGDKIFTMLCGEQNKEMGKAKSKPGLLDMERENPSGLGIIVLDSIAAVQPPLSQTKNFDDVQIAPMGRFLPDALRRLTPLLAQTGVVFVCINQVRVEIGKMFGDPTSTPGGKALKHACSLMVHFTLSQSNKSKIYNDKEEQIGHIVGARIDKNKMAAPKRTCNFSINYTSGPSAPHIEIADLALKYGVVEKVNNVTYSYGDKKWRGVEDFYSGVLKDNLSEELLEKIKVAKLNADPAASVIEKDTDEE